MKRYHTLLAILLLGVVAWLSELPRDVPADIPDHVPADVVRTASQIDYAFQGAQVREVKRFDAIFATAATHNVVSGVVDRLICIRSLDVTSLDGTEANVRFKTEDDDASTLLGTNATYTWTVDERGISGPAGKVKDWNPDGWATTSTTGKAFQLVLDAAVPIAVNGTYIEIDPPAE